MNQPPEIGDNKRAKLEAKAAKKAAKAASKVAKKGEAVVDRQAPSIGPSARQGPAWPAVPTPAERSAAAAERGVAINQRRFIVQIVAALLALLTILLTWLAYTSPGKSAPTANPAPATTQPS